MRCFWWPVLQQFHKSLIIVKYHVATHGFVTLELTNMTSFVFQKHCILCNSPAFFHNSSDGLWRMKNYSVSLVTSAGVGWNRTFPAFFRLINFKTHKIVERMFVKNDQLCRTRADIELQWHMRLFEMFQLIQEKHLLAISLQIWVETCTFTCSCCGNSQTAYECFADISPTQSPEPYKQLNGTNQRRLLAVFIKIIIIFGSWKYVAWKKTIVYG